MDWRHPARAQVTVDGILNSSEGYGSPLAIQTINTGFGDNSTDASGNSSGGSELDAVYGVVTNGYLYLFIAGNVQANGNNVNVFIADGQAGGQNVLEIGGSPRRGGHERLDLQPGVRSQFDVHIHRYCDK